MLNCSSRISVTMLDKYARHHGIRQSFTYNIESKHNLHLDAVLVSFKYLFSLTLFLSAFTLMLNYDFVAPTHLC
jgi:hypothetical protein